MEQCDVLIIGGGFAGINSAIELAKHGKDVLLVDKREYFEYTPGILRYLVASDAFDSISAYYSQITSSNGFRFLQGTVKMLKITSAVIDDLTVNFEHAIVACGCAYPSPIRPKISGMEERHLEVAEWRKEIQNAKKIAIIGGGLVGVELAGELVEAFPEKLVVLYTRGSELLQTMPKLARRAAQIWLEQRGVQFFFGHSIENAKEFDMVFKCTGNESQAVSFMKTFYDSSLDMFNRVLVNCTMQIKGSENIFAIGDCVWYMTGEEKNAYKAETDAYVATHNIINPNNMIHKDVNLPQIAWISLGSKYAITTFNNVVVFGYLQSYFKALMEKTKIASIRGSSFWQKFWHLAENISARLDRWTN